MKQRFSKIFFSLLTLGILFTACNKSHDAVEDNDNELITTMKLTFVPSSGGAALTYQYRDADGPGGAAPTQDDIVLAPSTTYAVTVQLLNETVTPAQDQTLEVADESQAHRFFYTSSAGANITVTGLNNDFAGIPVGITSTWTTGAAATGTMNVTLRHYGGTPPGKAIDDLVDSPKSSTDAEVVFNTKVQ